ncbi:hypothetical protein NIES2111_32040 [Nostoc sp. NIES-2111]|nr:hypothetical protein NIES2111_32040 [Nostoc sp. NIES-2111]
MVAHISKIVTSLAIASISISSILGIAPPASAQQIITCESQNNRRTNCAIPPTGRVRLIRQLSDASCRGNWGYTRNRIYVRNGCRAQFALGNSRFNRDNRYNRDTRYERNRRYNRY